MSASRRRDLKEAVGETRPRRTGTGQKAHDRGVSRQGTVKSESYPDAVGVIRRNLGKGWVLRIRGPCGRIRHCRTGTAADGDGGPGGPAAREPAHVPGRLNKVHDA